MISFHAKDVLCSLPLGCEPRDRWFVVGYSPAPTGVRFGSHFEDAYVTIWVESSIVSGLQYYWHASSSIEPPVDDSHSCPSAVHCRVACLRSVETHLVTSWFVHIRCTCIEFIQCLYVYQVKLMNKWFAFEHVINLTQILANWSFQTRLYFWFVFFFYFHVYEL